MPCGSPFLKHTSERRRERWEAVQRRSAHWYAYLCDLPACNLTATPLSRRNTVNWPFWAVMQGVVPQSPDVVGQITLNSKRFAERKSLAMWTPALLLRWEQGRHVA